MDINRFSEELGEGIYDSIRQRAKGAAQEVSGKMQNRREIRDIKRQSKDIASGETATLDRVDKDRVTRLYQTLKKTISDYTKIAERDPNSKRVDVLKNQIKSYSEQIKRLTNVSSKE